MRPEGVISMRSPAAGCAAMGEKLVVRPGGGVGIQAPRTDGAGHADLAFALVAAVAIDAKLHGLIGDAQATVRTHRGAWTAP